jgi:Ca2+-binding EF-hand superfamily protein
MSMQAVIQKQKTANMFKVFDTDGSGALDAQELTVLYKQNGVHVEESDIEKMYGDPKVKFTLEMFDQLPKQP